MLVVECMQAEKSRVPMEHPPENSDTMCRGTISALLDQAVRGHGLMSLHTNVPSVVEVGGRCQTTIWLLPTCACRCSHAAGKLSPSINTEIEGHVGSSRVMLVNCLFTMLSFIQDWNNRLSHISRCTSTGKSNRLVHARTAMTSIWPALSAKSDVR
jgi:hypothetical protein